MIFQHAALTAPGLQGHYAAICPCSWAAVLKDTQNSDLWHHFVHMSQYLTFKSCDSDPFLPFPRRRGKWGPSRGKESKFPSSWDYRDFSKGSPHHWYIESHGHRCKILPQLLLRCSGRHCNAIERPGALKINKPYINILAQIAIAKFCGVGGLNNKFIFSSFGTSRSRWGCQHGRARGLPTWPFRLTVETAASLSPSFPLPIRLLIHNEGPTLMT